VAGERGAPPDERALQLDDRADREGGERNLRGGQPLHDEATRQQPPDLAARDELGARVERRQRDDVDFARGA